MSDADVPPEHRDEWPSEMMESRLMHDSAVAEARFRGMVEVAPDAIIIVDRTGKMVLVNGQAETLFGYSRDEMLGQPVELLLPDRFLGPHSQYRFNYTSSPRIRPMGANLDLFAKRKDQTEFPVEISLGPVEVDAELLVMTTIRDITERKLVQQSIELAREEAERANSAKSEFLSRMSHELRTPLNAILGFGQLLQMDTLTAEQRESVEHILRAGNHLLELINEVLEISRIEAGRLSLSLEPISLDEVLRETEDLIRPMIRERNLRLNEESRSSGLQVQADRQRLRQVLLNLLANAAKYNRPGGSVTVAATRMPEGRLRVSVTDTGPGIAEEKRQRLFTPFERLGAEQTDVEGTGLGLALSQRLAEAMGGTLGVDSVPGQGSTFWLELSEADSSAAIAAADEAAVRDQARVSPTRTVLYIEDNLASLQLIERIFSRWQGVKLLSAMQGSLGLDLAGQHTPHLILLDLHLPDMHGMEVLERLRADPATKDIPVIVTSADATPGQQDRLISAGADGYMTKPLDIPEFLSVIQKHLE